MRSNQLNPERLVVGFGDALGAVKLVASDASDGLTFAFLALYDDQQ